MIIIARVSLRAYSLRNVAAPLGVAALLLAGCAAPPRYAAGEALLKGETFKLPERPDSVRAELGLTAFAAGRKSSVSAALSSQPRTKYKLDVFGLPGVVAASFLWQPEGWTLVMFDRESFAEDTGEHVEFGNLGIHEVSVHNVFSFLWGDFFPGISGNNRDFSSGDFLRKEDGSFQYAVMGQRWTTRLDAATGLVQGVVREDSAFRIEYAEYKLIQGRPMPRKVTLYSRIGLLLEIRVKSVEDNPHWRRNPFTVKVPKGFQRLERMPQNNWKE